VKTAVDVAEAPGAGIRSNGDRRSAQGCNPPQQRRHAPDTPWGRERAALGWSLRELAERSGVNRGDLSKFERGRGCPTPDQARQLLATFDEASR
jgi:hypothetical protein